MEDKTVKTALEEVETPVSVQYSEDVIDKFDDNNGGIHPLCAHTVTEIYGKKQ